MTLDVGSDFLDRMDTNTYQEFCRLQQRLETVERLMEDKLPNNRYKPLALDSLKLAIVSIAECLTEKE